MTQPADGDTAHPREPTTWRPLRWLFVDQPWAGWWTLYALMWAFLFALIAAIN